MTVSNKKELKSIKFPGLDDIYTVNSMPDGASANQQLVTDNEGVVKWEEKPFFYAEYGEDITWDGDTTGREIFVLEPFSFYKVSDTIYTTDTISGRKFTVWSNSGKTELQINESFLKSNPNIPNIYFVIPVNYQIPVIVFGSANEDINFPGGLFFLKNDDLNSYVNYLSGTANKTIDPLYLPEIPAEKLPYSVPTVVQKTFEGSFDKVTEGRDTFVFNAFNYYKMSEFSPRREDVIGFSGTRANGSVFSYITEGENCCEYGLFIVVYQAGLCTLAAGSITSFRFNAPSAGIYAKCEPGNNNMTAGTYNFTYKFVRNTIQSSTTFRRYYLDVDDSGALIAVEVTE